VIKLKLLVVGDGVNGDMQSNISKIIDQGALINNVTKRYLYIKRIFDIVVSLCALLSLSPIFIATAIWIKIHSRGAVLRTEEKYGLKGTKFKAYKFSKIVLSRHIRELPLLFNIFKGNMSFVGPQPTSVKEIIKDPWYILRMSAKPGITGLWQISRKSGGSNEMARVDLKYIRERSLWNDFKIILKTICLMLEKRGH
jgi:lipopolysaccharide/colanic/teichoic acid biosynthesis glycosyltransferase